MMRKILLVLSMWLLMSLLPRTASAQSGDVWVLEINGPVTPTMASYFERGIASAERNDANAVLIILDTPGGNVTPTQEIIRIFRAAKLPVIVFITPSGAQAASAGSIITMAAHFSAMSPQTVIGAASPVGEGGADLDETIYRKLTEDFTAQIRSLVGRRGEEATELAEAMINEARAVNAQEALAIGLIDAVATDVDDLLSQLDGETASIDGQIRTLETADAAQRRYFMNFIEQILHALSNPLLVSILLVIGVQAILIELGSPGGWVAGFIGILCLGLAFYGLGQLPANWFGLGLIAVAFVLFVLEVKALTHGALALAGTITMLAGLLVLFNSPGTPAFARISVPSAIAISGFTAMFFIFIVTMALRAQQKQPVTGVEGLIGHRAVIRTANPVDGPPFTGTALANGELWRVTADQPLAKGDEMVVSEVDGFVLHITKSGN